MKRLILVLAACFCSVAFASSTKPTLIPVKANHHHVQRHHAHKAGRHHAPRHSHRHSV